MKLYGSLERLVSILFRKDSQDITVRPNQATTYTAVRDVQLPAGDAAHVLVSRTSTDTLTNKTLTSPVINSPTGITKSDVGLGNVDNTSDASKNAAAVTLTNKTIDAASNTISNISNTEIKTGAAIDAAKIADGSVSSTEFQYINSLTSNAQTQLDAKATKALDNLASTAVNVSIIPGTDNSIDLGSAAKGYANAYANKLAMDSNSHTTTLAGHASASASVDYTLPAAAPASSGYVLAATTAGVMSWVAQSAEAKFQADWATADGTTKTITHSLGTTDIQVQLFDKTDGSTIMIDSVVRTDANTLDLAASEAPGAAGWRVLILAS